ncbi:MAG TPA: hypothetical protein VFT29_09010 [Gemmatimonadaceae bacterium]|nr:hypothetical protein [Gemmatimonadaceae bacterium]
MRKRVRDQIATTFDRVAANIESAPAAVRPALWGALLVYLLMIARGGILLPILLGVAICALLFGSVLAAMKLSPLKDSKPRRLRKKPTTPAAWLKSTQ